MAVSAPVTVLRVDVVDGYLAVFCSDGLTRLCKSFSPKLKGECEDIRDRGTPAVFKSFGSWSADRWFAEVEWVCPDILPVSDDVCIIDYTKLDADKGDIFMRAVKYALKRLRLTGDVGIDIKFQPVKEDGNTLGWAMPINKDDNDYRIMVSYNDDLFRAIETMFHELRHVAQWDAGVMKTKGLVTTWKDEDYHKHTTDYYTSPWEVDARKAAAIMLHDFKKGLK